LLEWLESKPTIANALPLKWLSPEQHSQQTPVGALFVHWTFTMILIGATSGQSNLDAYSLIITLYVFVIDAVFGLLLALGIIYLRAAPWEHWREKSSTFVPLLSITAAVLYTIGNLFPVVAIWIPLNGGKYAKSLKLDAPWFTAPTIGTSVVSLGIIWWVGFCVVMKRKENREHASFEVQRLPAFENEPPGSDDGYPVLKHETVYMSFLGQENSIPMN
jgi:amino acid transporter